MVKYHRGGHQGRCVLYLVLLPNVLELTFFFFNTFYILWNKKKMGTCSQEMTLKISPDVSLIGVCRLDHTGEESCVIFCTEYIYLHFFPFLIKMTTLLPALMSVTGYNFVYSLFTWSVTCVFGRSHPGGEIWITALCRKSHDFSYLSDGAHETSYISVPDYRADNHPVSRFKPWTKLAEEPPKGAIP